MEYVIARGKNVERNFSQFHRESQIVVEMTPQQFINLTPILRKPNRKTLEHLRIRLIQGLPIDIPYLDIDVEMCEVQGHEGRHRALASLMVGLEKIPVTIFLKYGWSYVDKKEVDVFKMCKKIKSQKCSLRGHNNYEKINSFVIL